LQIIVVKLHLSRDEDLNKAIALQSILWNFICPGTRTPMIWRKEAP
jgi:hypothetical protein